MSARLAKLWELRRSPLAWILAGVFVLHVIGIGWGLPATDGWDDDGVAPRDFLVGVAKTYTPGDYYTYPPVHLIILAILTAPIWIVGIARAPSLAPADVVREFLHVSYMTSFALVARVVAVVMSIATVYALAKLGEELRGRRAGLGVAVVVGLNAPFTYYAHTTNLEVPYLFWASFALLYLVRAMAREEPRLLRRVAVCAALAVATKDQAAALFVLGLPAALACWFMAAAWPRANARAVVKELAIAAVIAIALVLVVDGALFNPSGFRARLEFLLGPASQDHAAYARTWSGRVYLLRDTALKFARFYPAPFGLLVAFGLALQIARPGGPVRGAKLASGLVPLFAAASFLVLFNCTALRTDERFLLPEMMLLGVYAGLGLDALVFATSRGVAWVARVLAVPLVVWALFDCAAVDAVLLGDPRYDAEAFLEANIDPGDLVEIYGNHVYLPRLPAKARIVRVDQKPIDKRNPLPGVTEAVARFEDIEERKPRWIVLADTQLWPYLVDATTVEKDGRVLTPGQRASQHDVAARTYFQLLYSDRAGYRTAHVSTWESKLWPRVDLHASTTREIRIYERVAPP